MRFCISLRKDDKGLRRRGMCNAILSHELRTMGANNWQAFRSRKSQLHSRSKLASNAGKEDNIDVDIDIDMDIDGLQMSLPAMKHEAEEQHPSTTDHRSSNSCSE
ncbi:uncharacterized protein LOC108102886 [Drosophila eugracilis]|uniref:uncharacterized protein LOC108102886 n=1 Tax=Drosophila eugracilis TaxID=29029 RepID=UPI0007E7BD87|nr:uncharacterized protein LOC108102886 [Drosophila eugracilis]